MGVTRQVQRTRTKAITTKTAMSQKQSLDAVQTLLHGSLSTLSYLREFFPDKAFDYQIYGMADGIPSYQDFAEGKLNNKSSFAPKPKTPLQLLRRGRSKRADMFLDWLEKGAFVFLRDGRLQGLQVYVHAEPDHRDKAIEAYSFTVKYLSRSTIGEQVAGIELGSPSSEPITVEATNAGLQKLLRDIDNICKSLPILPENRYVSMALFYLPNDGQGYPPEGFEPSTTETTFFPRAEGWEKNVETLTLPSTFHSTAIKITHIRQPALLGLSGLEESRIPSKMYYGLPESRLKELGLDLTALNAPEDGASDISTGRISLTVANNNVVPDSANENLRPPVLQLTKEATRQQQQMTDDTPLHETRNTHRDNTPMITDSLDTQSSNVPNMKKALHEMMQPERLTQGDTQTQTLMAQAPLLRSVSRAVNESVMPAARTTTIPQSRADPKMILLPNIAARLESRKFDLRRTAPKLTKAPKSRSQEMQIIFCQCGHNKAKANMLNCSFCDTWQHLHCYGFSGHDDPRLPDQHTCYHCLLADNDDGLLEKMDTMALKRRAMIHAFENGLKRKTDLAKILEVSVSRADDIIKYLRAENYIVATSQSHKQGFAASGKPFFVSTKGGPVYEKMLQDLFNPLLHIQAYYQKAPPTSNLAGQQLLRLTSANMPPPATPRSETSKQATPSTASGPNVRASMPLHETQVRNRLPLKRGRSEDDLFSTPAKHAARATSVFRRLQSVQTQYVVSANGFSSSPATR